MPPYLPQADTSVRPMRETLIPPPTIPRGGAARPSQPSNVSIARSPERLPLQPSSPPIRSSPPTYESFWAGAGPLRQSSHVDTQRSPSISSKHIHSLSRPSLETSNAPLTSSRGSRIEVVLGKSPKGASLAQSTRTSSVDLEDQLVVSDVTPKQPSRKPLTLDPLPESTPSLPVLNPLPEIAATSPAAGIAPLAKKRGRPKGWKPGMPYSGSGAPSPKSSLKRADRREGNAVNYSLKQRRRGRPPRKPSPTPLEIFEKLQPRYVPFLCEWTGCPAELHNAETLRKHVYVVHGRSEHLTCEWAKCGEASPCPTFSTGDQFERHMEERHLVPFTWHLGDGYDNHPGPATAIGPSDSVPDYLLDDDGKQVTPSIKDQEVEDFITWRNNRRRLRELLIQRDANAPYEDEDGNEISP